MYIFLKVPPLVKERHYRLSSVYVDGGGPLVLDTIRTIRKIALTGLFSNDLLLERFVLKGGSALELVYNLSSRASIDIDISMEDDFTADEINDIKRLVEEALGEKFIAAGYYLFDFTFGPRPMILRANAPAFWGGYNIDFKIIPLATAQTLNFDIEQLRRRSSIATPSQGKKFQIEISKHEYCKEKTYGEIDGYKISVYTLRTILFEKLRAVCQQMKAYPHMKTASPRPRDFYDIQKIMAVEKIPSTLSPADIEIITAVFAQKEVPLVLLDSIDQYKDFHQQDLTSLLDTLAIAERAVFDFDSCYAQVVALGKNILAIKHSR